VTTSSPRSVKPMTGKSSVPRLSPKQLCSGCHACSSVCPASCISMTGDSEGFLYPDIDMSRCRHCGLCEQVCPVVGSYEGPKSSTPVDGPSSFAVQAKDAGLRARSSSGGAFGLIATAVLRQGGVVFGAAFDQDWSVCHLGVTSEDELPRLMGSKYVQSRIGDVFRDVKRILDEGNAVLFSGTPCQVVGLQCFLGADYASLVTADFICHGVPSPVVWAKYVEERESASGARVVEVQFRNKVQGWKLYSLSFRFSDASEQVRPLTQDPYMRAFLSDIDLRPSCHSCGFKSVQRQSDFTLADLWGVESVVSTMDDDKGTSLVLVHTAAGQELLDHLGEAAEVQSVDLASAVKNNPALTTSAPVNPLRDRFMLQLETLPLEQLVEKYLGANPTSKARRVVARAIRRLRSQIGLPVRDFRQLGQCPEPDGNQWRARG